MAHAPEIVEAVARAICAEQGTDPDQPYYWEGKKIGSGWHLLGKQATAALDAITAAGCVVVPAKPTGEMGNAGYHAGGTAYEWVWRAMLAARPGAQP